MKRISNREGIFGYHGGFTITELLIVIAILGTLMATVIYGLRSSRDRAKVATAKNEIRFYGMTLQQYRNGHLYDPNKWPIADGGDATKTTSYDGSECKTNAEKTVPSALTSAGEQLWKDSPLTKFCYYRKAYAPGEEVGILWPGLKNDDKNIADLNAINGSDNLLLIVQDAQSLAQNDVADVRNTNLNAADKNRVLFLSGK